MDIFLANGEPGTLTNLANLLGRLAARDWLAAPQTALQDATAPRASNGSSVEPQQDCTDTKEL
jgi:hypothetical protein